MKNNNLSNIIESKGHNESEVKLIKKNDQYHIHKNRIKNCKRNLDTNIMLLNKELKLPKNILSQKTTF